MTKIDLKPHFERFIEDQLASGRFSDASAVVEEALALLEEKVADRELALAEVRAKIQESLDDPRPNIPAEEVFAELRAKLGRIRAEVNDA